MWEHTRGGETIQKVAVDKILGAQEVESGGSSYKGNSFWMITPGIIITATWYLLLSYPTRLHNTKLMLTHMSVLAFMLVTCLPLIGQLEQQ